jgi:hypothetical protein
MPVVAKITPVVPVIGDFSPQSACVQPATDNLAEAVWQDCLVIKHLPSGYYREDL